MKDSQRAVTILRSNAVSPDPRVEKIGLWLHKCGYKVNILGWDRTGLYPLHEKIRYAEITRIGVRSRYGGGIKSFFKIIVFWVAVIKYLSKNRTHFFHACDFDTYIPALVAAKIFNKRVVYDILDFYADGATVPNLIRPFIQFIDRILMYWADAIIVVDENRIPFIPKSLRHKTNIIYNIPFEISLSELEKNIDAIIPNKKQGVLRVVYAGYLHHTRFVIELATAISRLPEFELVIAGTGPDKEIIAQSIKELGTNNIRLLGNLTYRQALALENSADIIAALYSPLLNQNKVASPNKFFEAMLLEKTVLVNENISIDEKVRTLKCGVIIHGNITTDNIIKTLKPLSDNPQIVKQMGKNAKRAYLVNFNEQTVKTKLCNIYKSLNI